MTERYPDAGETRALAEADEARRLIASRAYRCADDPMHGEVHARVRTIFVRHYGTEPIGAPRGAGEAPGSFGQPPTRR